jgi:hypothetical protein
MAGIAARRLAAAAPRRAWRRVNIWVLLVIIDFNGEKLRRVRRAFFALRQTSGRTSKAIFDRI